MSSSGRRHDRGRESNQNKPETGFHGKGKYRSKSGGDYRRGPILGYRKLQQLSTAEPSDIVEELFRCRESYKTLITSDHIREDWIPLLSKVLCKICSSKMKQNVMELLQELQQSSFLTKHLPQYILQLHFIQEDVEDVKDFKAVLQSISTFFKEWLARFPNSYLQLPLDAFSGTLKRIVIVNVGEIDKEIETMLNDRLEKLKRDRKPDKKEKEEIECKPPNDFRQIAVYPTSDEIHSREETFLRKNRIKRSYDDLNDYLDVQFRLLREDFVAPLRAGIQEILSDAPRDERSQDLYIYHQVEILEPRCMKSGVAHRLSFDITKLKKVPWEHSKRLMYGSFLCLSTDKFRRTLLFATVANRKHEDLRKGYIDIRFVRGQELLQNIRRGQKLLMVESPAYFESYRHVLARLQEINQDTFPFQKYLVNCVSEVDPPLYLRGGNAQQPSYDLRGAFGAPDLEAAKQVPILELEAWPSSCESEETLNKSQLEALHAALSKEFAVIQGPPGTGKTYVGLKVVRALLDNPQAWDPEGNSPLLMVCYTNHALDQFLEGVLDFTPSGIIRVGGQSSSEKLKDFNLHLFTRASENRPQVLADMRACQEDIERAKADLQHSQTGILQLRQLEGNIPSQHYDQLAYEEYKYKAEKESIVEAWLGLQPFQGLKQCVEAGLREEQSNTDSVEENITVDEDAEVLERKLYQSMDEFLPVNNRDHTKDTKHTSGTSMSSSNRPHKGQLQMLQGDGNLFAMTDKEAKSEKVRKIWKILRREDRWRLYLFWLSCYQKRCLSKISKMSDTYEKICQRLSEVEDNDRLKALREAKVIGMTTTGAAKYRTVLEQIQPKIVVVEEAAEVLEAHIITAVTQGTQHLILIGDHKQLKPNPTVYRLATKYNLDISLFERMVKNGMHCNVLTTQHRMRPEISQLMKHIYTDLQDHPSVCDYDNIRGIRRNIFFIDHRYLETENKELRSHSNKHEAEYIRELCRYLLLQGYSPQQITVLTTYTGQLIEMRKLMPRNIFEGVRVTAVDNFQGEENDIILLSLVRSNDKGKVGFLKVDNRVCVALSRARMGFYCIGNFKSLVENSKLWSSIVGDMKKRDAIGDALELVCENHPESTIMAKTSTDFKKAPEGGCMLPCDYRLDCGHVCEIACHPIDREHEEYTCRKKCLRLLCDDHQTRCKKDCHYGSPCGPCPVQKEKQISICGHTQIVLCGVPAEEFECQVNCPKTLQCGHPCPAKCFVNCTSLECEEPYVKDLPCGHEVETICSRKYDHFRCEAPCDVLLECSHPCPGNCSDCRQGRMHVQCQQPCQRDLVCQHQCDFPCTKNCPPCKKKCQNRCVHSKCPLKCYKICTPCKEPCSWRCEHYACDRLCGELCAHVRCDKPCRKRLPSCGHPCIGLCGEKCPRLCRVCDKDEVTETFFGTENEPGAVFVELIDCGHVIEVGAMDTYMALQPETEEDLSEGERAATQTQNIKLKGCPKCNTPIRRSFRYADIVKQLLHDIDVVKQKMLDEEKSMIHKTKKLLSKIRELSKSFPACDLSTLINWLRQRRSTDELTTIENQLRLQEQICKIRSSVKKELLKIEDDNSAKPHLYEVSVSKDPSSTKRQDAASEVTLELDRQETMLMKFQISEQMLLDIRDEIQRMGLLLRLRSFECDLVERSIQLSTSSQLRLSQIETQLTRGKRISIAQSEVIEAEMNKLRTDSGQGALSKEERVMIVKAMRFSKGHWYKCPNGHVYAIGDCGGANQESTCPECHSVIGGMHHTLHAGNEVATEMDGAKHGAWSEQANLENYDPALLRRLQFE